MENNRIKPVDVANELSTSFLDYSMSVIISRALPDVRDGLKPSQRRILYAMKELNLSPGGKTRKCSKIVGDTMGNYHPHGDAAIYGTLVNMAQDWSMRDILVIGQGNFGTPDGDPPRRRPIHGSQALRHGRGPDGGSGQGHRGFCSHIRQ